MNKIVDNSYIYEMISDLGFTAIDYSHSNSILDILIEQSNGTKPSGKMVAAVVKSGEAFFSPNYDSLSINLQKNELFFLLTYSLPTIIIVHSPEKEIAYWNKISIDRVLDIRDSTDIKLNFPKSNILDKSSTSKLSVIASGNRIANSDEHPDRWLKITKLLVEFKYRTNHKFLENCFNEPIFEYDKEEEVKITELIMEEINFLSDFIKNDTIANNFSINKKEELENVLNECKSIWQGNYLGNWLLTKFGWITKDWQQELEEYYKNQNEYIFTRDSFYCPVCLSDNYTKLKELDLSYQIAFRYYDHFEVFAKCNECKTLFRFEWGGY